MTSPRGPRDVAPTWLVRTLLCCVALLVLAHTVDLVVGWFAAVLTVTAALVAALLLTALLRPVATRLGRVAPGWLAALVTILVTAAAVSAVGFVVVARAVRQVDDLRQAVDDGLATVQSWVEHSGLPMVPANFELAQSELMDRFRDVLPSPGVVATMAADILAGTALAVFVWFFLLKDGARMWGWFRTWLPDHRIATVDGVGHASWGVLERYMQGMTMVALIDAAAIGGAMTVLGVPLAASLTCVVFVGAYVPVVGAFVSGGLAALATLVLLGPTEALILSAVVILVQQVEGNVLQPLVMGKALHLHPVAVVVSVGALVAGVLGALVAVPVVAVAYRAVRELRGAERERPHRDPVAAG